MDRSSMEVVVPVYRGGDLPPVVLEATVRPPTVGEALAVLSGDADAAASSWLPPRFASEVRALSPGPRQTLLTGLLAHASGADETTPTQTPAGAERAQDALQDAVMDAASIHGHEAVMRMPWAAFLAMTARARRRRAEDAIEAATAVRVGQHADASGWKAYTQALTRIAGTGTPKPKLTPEQERAARAQSEHIRAQIERRKRTGSALPQTDDERARDADLLAAMQAATPEAKA